MKERRRKKNLNYIINSFPPFYMLNVIVFFFSRSFFFFYPSHKLTSRYVLFSPPVLLTNGHIYYFLITALRDAQFSRENSAIFHVGGEEGALLCVLDCPIFRHGDAQKGLKGRASWKCIIDPLFFFLSKKKMCGSRFSHADYKSLSESVFSDSTPLFFLLAALLSFFFFIVQQSV